MDDNEVAQRSENIGAWARITRLGQCDALTLRFDPQLPPTSLDVRRGTAKDTPSADRQVLNAAVSDPSQFTADLPDGVSYLAVSAGFAQGNSSYFFKVDVRPPPAVPGPRVVRRPNFTG